jgi:hypothetical protein
MKFRKSLLVAAAGALALGVAVFAAPVLTSVPASAQEEVEVWKSPSCGCCGGWVNHMKAAGFTVKTHETEDMESVKLANGVPETLGSCHTAKVGGYIVEGHVPAQDVMRLLAERPQAKGLAAPGMPTDAPGMDMKTGQPYDVMLFGATGGDTVFARH